MTASSGCSANSVMRANRTSSRTGAYAPHRRRPPRSRAWPACRRQLGALRAARRRGSRRTSLSGAGSPRSGRRASPWARHRNGSSRFRTGNSRRVGRTYLPQHNRRFPRRDRNNAASRRPRTGRSPTLMTPPHVTRRTCDGRRRRTQSMLPTHEANAVVPAYPRLVDAREDEPTRHRRHAPLVCRAATSRSRRA